ncbi:hypothetical protein MYSTI_04376 [Myxococcus stipitatus DSM 14675]|uniref:Uncharacterized protein n=1 Tax=Myxococcus stipitatus (strain DSM 14675 / JCM 12634 / Mx s8) TaxID=1278073 RepID=L7UDI4_MYXSD|nr:hypothetical protein [Myxococcus stipitatus]AGC45672.1 hypothetical protein MYSTI_04376 [Myxococcus stipitatus DSM 14675]
MPTVFSANRSSILVDGEAVEGLQSIAFRVVTEREDIRAIGSNERVDVIFGLRTVVGELVIRSSAEKLDALLDARGKFQLVANLKRAEGTDDTRTLSFDDCFVEGKSFQMDAHGSAATTYAFTATRLREE